MGGVDSLLDAQHRNATRSWALVLAVVCAAIAVPVTVEWGVTPSVVGGLIVFGVAFAMNSSLHSFLVLAFADDEDVALDVGFYYSANAAGRLVGTLLSGVLYVWGGLSLALWGSVTFVVATWLAARRLPPFPAGPAVPPAAVDGGD